MIIQSAPQTAVVLAVLSYTVIIPKADNAATTIIVGGIFYKCSWEWGVNRRISKEGGRVTRFLAEETILAAKKASDALNPS